MEHDRHWFSSNGTKVTILIFVVNFLLLVANLYLSNGYVSKTVYESDQRDATTRRDLLNVELRNIAVELRGISDHMQGDARQDKRLDDLEQRVREQEKK